VDHSLEKVIDRVWQACHTRFTMKMTMHIDEALLAEVMAATGAASKTAAVDAALRKVARKFRMREVWSKGLGTAEEIRAGFDADLALGISPSAPSLVAEKPAVYGRKRAR
jgi:Arc/MetJ family transcription regulator